MDMKDEYLVSQRQTVSKDVGNNTTSLNDDGVKSEVREETPFPGFCSENEREYFIKDLVKQIKIETITLSDDSDNEITEGSLVTDFDSQRGRECFPEDPVIKDKKHVCDYETDNEVEIIEECWWLQTSTQVPSVEAKDCTDEVFLPEKSARCYMQPVSADSSQDSEKNVKLSMEMCSVQCYNIQGSDVTETAFFEKSVFYQQPSKFYEFFHPYRCHICKEYFSHVSHLKWHNNVFHKTNSVHEERKQFKCQICNKLFSHLATLKRHNVLHEDSMRYRCDICERSFTQLSHLKRHNLIHKRKRPYEC